MWILTQCSHSVTGMVQSAAPCYIAGVCAAVIVVTDNTCANHFQEEGYIDSPCEGFGPWSVSGLMRQSFVAGACGREWLTFRRQRCWAHPEARFPVAFRGFSTKWQSRSASRWALQEVSLCCSCNSFALTYVYVHRVLKYRLLQTTLRAEPFLPC